MGLTAYKRKRDFRKTTEPATSKKKKSGKLIFVVQQHSASHLHYDFRLEMEGVLKSWAVPKGPSMNPDDKRLAMMVEDHPYDYKDFEGTIPEGSYGAGNVIVWDNGTYKAAGGNGNDEKTLLAGLRKGHVAFILNGKKLKGEFALVRLKDAGDNSWLLIKKKDRHASSSDILKKDRSVISRKKLKLREKKTVKKSPVFRAVVKESGHKSHAERDLSGKALRKPMLAELAGEAFDDADWVYEIKYDGYRTLADLDGSGKVQLYSRNLLSFNETFKPVADELKKIAFDALLDGEVVVEDSKGRSHFQLLQNYQKTKEGSLKYYVFDLLRLDGKDMTGLTLLQRKEILKTLLGKYRLRAVYFSDHVAEKGKAFFDAAVRQGLEGIVAKHAQSAYYPGERSGNWKKIKNVNQQEVVIAGITDPKGSRNHFGSLVLGLYEKGKFIYCGNCGTGFNEASLSELYEKLQPLFTDESPFKEKISFRTPVQWVKPRFVCEVKFTEWTADGSMRHPVYLGLRKDKKPMEVKKEIASPGKEKKKPASPKPASQKGKNKTSAKNAKAVARNDVELKMGKIILKLTNQHKLYFPKDKITKGEVVDYYREIASVMLPYLKDRPQSMNRFPNGISGESFFQKDVDRDKIPAWVQTEKIFSESNSKYIDYIVCNDAATLVYMANLGCIEINPWNSTIKKPEYPDWAVIDLDPEKIEFTEVIRAAQEVRRLLEKMEIESFCKTSGATGLHIYIPLAARYDYDIVKTFAQVVAELVNKKLPETTSILRLPSKRQGKVYLDFLQNRRGQTLAAPYSARPRPGATVSTPLEWKEVNGKLNPSVFTIKTIFKRLEKKGDLWKPVIGKGADLAKALKKIGNPAD